MKKQEVLEMFASAINGAGIVGTKAQMKEAYTAFFTAIRTEVATPGGEVPLDSLGVLKNVVRQARTGRNPATGAAIQIAAKSAIKFRPSGGESGLKAQAEAAFASANKKGGKKTAAPATGGKKPAPAKPAAPAKAAPAKPAAPAKAAPAKAAPAKATGGKKPAPAKPAAPAKAAPAKKPAAPAPTAKKPAAPAKKPAPPAKKPVKKPAKK